MSESRLTELEAPSARQRLPLAALTALLLALPMLAARFPPVTDLPQIVGQAEFFLRALGEPDGPLRIQWLQPGSLSYALLGVARSVAGPVGAGRALLLLIASLFALALHALAWHRRRSAAGAVLASALLFNHGFYYGFLSFTVGLAAFAPWFLLLGGPRGREPSARGGVALAILALLLLWAHALWLAFGLLWLVLQGVLARLPWRIQLWRLVSIAPVAVGAMLWFSSLEGWTQSTASAYGPALWLRLSPGWWGDAVLGGMRGAAEPLLLGAIGLWLVMGAWRHRGDLRRGLDRELFAVAALALGLALVLPEKLSNTLEFASRWVPMGAALLLLALPVPRLGKGMRRLLAVALLAAFTTWTTLNWAAVERFELAGLEEALEALPRDSRLIGYDLLGHSAYMEGFPFFHQSAWALPARGAELHFSFADHATSPVVHRRLPRSIRWTPGGVHPGDWHHFDYVLAGGPPGAHRVFKESRALRPVSDESVWRLYEVLGR